ncbi:MAG: hypothetical protein ACQERN_01765 [Thermodesulfobacteriota bacterium]
MAGQASDRHQQEGAEFLETLFRLLGEKRHTVIRFVQMKLDKEKRRFFRREMAGCRSIKAESRCVKDYIAHLSVKDVRALLTGLPEMAAEKDEALIYPGETLPEKRLAKFARTYGVSDAEMNRCMLFSLLMA